MKALQSPVNQVPLIKCTLSHPINPHLFFFNFEAVDDVGDFRRLNTKRALNLHCWCAVATLI